ncbi:MAG: cold-shock protein [Promethearchaeia archaeon]
MDSLRIRTQMIFFVHYTDIESEKSYKFLNKDDIVEFDVESTDRGPQAVNVRVLERASEKIPKKPDWYARRSF